MLAESGELRLGTRVIFNLNSLARVVYKLLLYLRCVPCSLMPLCRCEDTHSRALSARYLCVFLKVSELPRSAARKGGECLLRRTIRVILASSVSMRVQNMTVSHNRNIDVIERYTLKYNKHG